MRECQLAVVGLPGVFEHIPVIHELCQPVPYDDRQYINSIVQSF